MTDKETEHLSRAGAEALGKRLVAYWEGQGAVGVSFEVTTGHHNGRGHPLHGVRLLGMDDRGLPLHYVHKIKVKR